MRRVFIVLTAVMLAGTATAQTVVSTETANREDGAGKLPLRQDQVLDLADRLLVVVGNVEADS